MNPEISLVRPMPRHHLRSIFWAQSIKAGSLCTRHYPKGTDASKKKFCPCSKPCHQVNVLPRPALKPSPYPLLSGFNPSQTPVIRYNSPSVSILTPCLWPIPPTTCRGRNLRIPNISSRRIQGTTTIHLVGSLLRHTILSTPRISPLISLLG